MTDKAPARETMEFDVVVVGAGPSGLAAAIRLKQLAPEASVCVVEKGSEVGAHILSGAVFEPRALNELIPDWKERGAPLNTPATEDRFLYLTETRALQPADAAADAQSRQLHRQPRQCLPLAGAAGRGARASRSIPASPPPRCCTTRTAACAASRPATWGSARTASRPTAYQRGIELRARYTLFAEGCRGSLTKQLIERFNLRDGHRPADLRDRHQGVVGGPAGNAPAGPGRAHDRLAARRRHLWRLVPLPFRRQPGRRRLRRRARLPQSVSVAVRGVAALQDASGDPRRISRAAGASATARARSTRAASSRSRG